MDRTMRPAPLLSLLLALGLFAAGCGGGTTPSAHPTLPSAPGALPTFDLGAFRSLLTDLHGRPVVVNIWASWCGPCIVEAPHLAAIARQTKGRAQFVGVDIEDQLVPARAFIHRFGWIYPSVFDPPGAIRDGLGLIGQPNTVLYDAAGHQVEVWSGPVDAAALSAELDRLLAP
jgi:thiol-disulfide isomerase/thioredoxin